MTLVTRTAEKSEKASTIAASIDTPPSYEDSVNPTVYGDSSDDDLLEDYDGKPPYLPESGSLPLPVVIPQTTKSFSGVIFSPFMRAYVPQLEAHGISQSEFLTFIDGLNEASITHPIYQGLGIVRGVLGAYRGVQPIQRTGVASAATSYLRTKAYVKAVNTDLFHPAGLHLHVLTTRKMMEKVGIPEDRLRLPPLDLSSDLHDRKLSREQVENSLRNAAPQDDPRLRRLQALEGRVMPLRTDVPDATTPDNLFRKIGAAHADRMSRKQNRKTIKRRSKVDRRQQRGDEKLEKFAAREDEQKAEFERKMALCRDGREQAKLLRNYENDQEKLNRKVEKSIAKTERKVEKSSYKAEKRGAKVERKVTKTASKIRWLVITRWVEEDDSDEDSLPSSDEDGGTWEKR